MSALGHKRTFRSAIATSALPPKADINRRLFGLVTLSMWRLAKTLAMIARRLCEKVEAPELLGRLTRYNRGAD